MGEMTYNVRSAAGVAFETDERGAWEALNHAAICQGCAGGKFHRSDVFGTRGLTPGEVFAVTLPTGAVLYPSHYGDRPIGERVAATLDVVRRARARGLERRRISPVTLEALDARIARLEAFQAAEGS